MFHITKKLSDKSDERNEHEAENITYVRYLHIRKGMNFFETKNKRMTWLTSSQILFHFKLMGMCLSLRYFICV